MPRNRVQHQKGLSDDAFERRYSDEGGMPESVVCLALAWRKAARIVRGVRGQSIVRSVDVNFYNAGSAAIRRR